MQGPAFSPTASISAGEMSPPLDRGEQVVAEAGSVTLGWQPRTILIWWLPGIVFLVLTQIEFQSPIVTAGLALFCIALFAFYAQDREVRPRAAKKVYILTDRRLLVGDAGAGTWRTIDLSDIAGTDMEDGPADRVVARLSAAATIVLRLRSLGPKGEARRVRIGPMRRPVEFRAAIDGASARPGRAGV